MTNTEPYPRTDLPLPGQQRQLSLPHRHHHLRLHRVPSGGKEEEDEELDPRVQVELDKLNRASEDINRLEMELDDARTAFRQVLSESTQCLNTLSRKFGSCVEKARPYYDAKMRLKEAHLESQKAVLRFERSCRMHEAAREMVQLAEEGYKRREQDLDPTWQEMLNHATLKVNNAEKERLESEQHHHTITLIFKRREEEVQRLYKDLKKVIAKSRPYFEMKEKFHQLLENHKRSVSRLENEVGSAKSLYSQTLHNLEAISDSIHQHRLEQALKLQLGVREAGVGAEAPLPSLTCGKGTAAEGSYTSHNVFSEENTNSTSCMLDSSDPSTQMTRSTDVTLYGPMCSRKHDASRQDGHLNDSQRDMAEASSSLSGHQSVPNLVRYPQKCRPESGCQEESKFYSCQDSLAINKWEIEGMAKRIALIDPEKSCNDNNLSALQLSQPEVASQRFVITDSLRPDSAMPETHRQAIDLCHDCVGDSTSFGSPEHLHQNSTPPTDSPAPSSPKEHPNLATKVSRSQPSLVPPIANKFMSSHYNTASMRNMPEHISWESGFSAGQAKSSKLQGIILQVDTAGILSVRPSSHLSADFQLERSPKVIISTHHPMLGVFIERPSETDHSK